MQIFVLGPTKAGKTTLANSLSTFAQRNGTSLGIYEAGAWARAEFAASGQAEAQLDEMDPAYKEALTRYALTKLKENPYYSLDQYRLWRFEHEDIADVAIVGVRNPDDFLGMLQMDEENYVLRIASDKTSAGTLRVFEEGLTIIEHYLAWRERLGNGLKTVTIPEDRVNDAGHFIGVFTE